jgi:chitodextrinase
VTGTTANSATVAWTASTDNVGVTGYTVYNGTTAAGNTTSTSYAVTGLTCGTGYTIAVDAVDAAGNRSGKSTVSVTTAACAAPSGSGVYVSPSGNDSTCVKGDQSKPCASLNKALSLVQGGDKIQLAGGTYGSPFGCNSANQPRNYFQVLQSFSTDVTIGVAAGATVIIPCQVNIGDQDTGNGGDHIGFDASGGTIKIDGFRANGDYDFLKNVDITCVDGAPYPTVNGFCSAPIRGSGNYFTMTGGSVGPTYAGGATGLDDSSIGYTQPNGQLTGWTFNGVHFHDARWSDTACSGACHTENLYLLSVSNFTFKNNLFTGCGNSAGIFVTYGLGYAYDSKNIQILGNVFNCFNMDLDIGAGNKSTNVATIAYNDMGGSNLSGGTMTFSSNIAGNEGCPDLGRSTVQVNYDHNLWKNSGAAKCGTTDVVAAVDPFVNSAGGDYHLKSGSNPAVDMGNVSDASLANPDYYGQARSCGAPDAGAAERCP